MNRSVSLVDRARQCRRLAQHCTDARTISVLIDTAESYEQQARAARQAAAASPTATGVS